MDDRGSARAPVVLNLRAAARPTVTGVERWAVELGRRLPRLDPGAYRTALPRPRLTGRAGGQAWEQLGLPRRARALGARLILSPANLAPLAWPGNVVVVHDAAALREPDAYSAAYRAWHRIAEVAAARRARAVITVSEFSRDELVSLLGIDPSRLRVIPGGVDPRFCPPGDPSVDPGSDAAALRTLGLKTGGYVLTVATADARKNLGALEPVAAALAERGLELAWVGDTRGYFAAVGAPPGVRALGYVDDAALAAAYRGAAAFVLPSRYEGFGLPCLEAMASGTPVIAADRAALPETCGDAALLADPDDPRALVAAVMEAVDADPAERDARRAAGVRRAASFTWDRTAASVDALLRSV